MAAIGWADPIKKTKQLSVFAGSGATSATWKKVLADAIKEFNQLSAQHSLGVTLVTSTTPPDKKGSGGANIHFDAVSGSAGGESDGEVLKPVPFSGTGLHGLTRLISGGPDLKSLRIIRAWIFVPSSPQGQNRAAGDGVKRFIAIHEFIHAVSGLDNSDHSNEQPGNADVFVGMVNASPQFLAGKTPADDKIQVGVSGKFTTQPPILISGRVAGQIKSVW